MNERKIELFVSYSDVVRLIPVYLFSLEKGNARVLVGSAF